jgi:hypothetical protein
LVTYAASQQNIVQRNMVTPVEEVKNRERKAESRFRFLHSAHPERHYRTNLGASPLRRITPGVLEFGVVHAALRFT